MNNDDDFEDAKLILKITLLVCGILCGVLLGIYYNYKPNKAEDEVKTPQRFLVENTNVKIDERWIYVLKDTKTTNEYLIITKGISAIQPLAK
jgi:hypothetical protein